MNISTQLAETKSFLENKLDVLPKIGLILGSGLGVLTEELSNKIEIPYEDIPNFPVSTVEGHAGQLVVGELAGVSVLIMDGRFHFYEGYSMGTVTFPIRVMSLLNIESLIVTNAAGGCDPTFTPGDLMIIDDHINFFGTNPLIGPNMKEFGPRFPDMSEAYYRPYRELVEKVAQKLDISIKHGVYIGMTGPTYETPAEIKMAQVLGASAVGMSTVPEVIVANHSGIKCVGISCITNMAAGLQVNLNHEEVVETTQRVKNVFKQLVTELVVEIHNSK
ncbi:purine-nucleoside phosphorylase [Atopobacter phocae]|uniref:purine-nucleoside phosphorylase n=1 Tax=Atopobacter phocae TaxID=136492 RepID=UPI00046FF5DA|nr:purine-nucleoside phosphorylase [Atopobacter phocae]